MINQFLGEISKPASVLFLVLIAGLVGFLLRTVIIVFFQRIANTQGTWPRSLNIGKHFFPAFWLLMVLFLGWMLLPSLQLSKSIHTQVETALKFLGTIVIAWNLTKLLSLFRTLVYSRFSSTPEESFKNRKIQTQFQFIQKILNVLIWTIGIALALMTFEPARRLGASLLASAGLASVILGFAAQKSISNLLAGFQIAFTQPIRIDDTVVIENEWGKIEEITLTYVVVELWDLRRLIVPITYFLEKPFTNWTRSSSEILGSVFVHVDYSVPVEEIRTEFMRILDASELWNRRTANLVVFDTTDKTIQLRAVMSADDADKAFDLRYVVREGLITFLQRRSPGSFPTVRFTTNENLPTSSS